MADTEAKLGGARRRRLFIFASLGVLALVFLVWAFRPRPVLVDIGEVTRGTMSVEIAEEAKTRIREIYVVSAPVSGRLERVEVEPGDLVQAGRTSVASMRPAEPVLLDARTRAEFENAVQSAEAARDAARADARRAQTEYDRAQSDFERDANLLERGTIAQARFDTTSAARDAARAAWDSAREILRAREADLARAQAALIGPSGGEGGDGGAYVTLHAPVDGAVLNVMHESETVLAAGAQILSIGDPRDLEIVSEMLSLDAVHVRQGAPVRIDGWGGDELEGRVRRVEPAAFTKISALGVEEQRVNVIVDIVSPREDWAGLAHQFRADVHVETWADDDVVQIPVAALFRQGDGWETFAVERGRVAATPLEIGRMNDQTAQVLSGLEEGAQVVLHPSARVEDGVGVAERSEGT
ncbi:MAG: HlyD family efflux transporter periplasmic adaptor subunit [Maricaulaceae bacterium]|jgi:HlyD family secretion protein